jgi:hypothetical protein
MAYCDAVFMLNENEGYAGGDGGWIYHTTNGGDSWQLLNSMGSNCMDISFAPGSAVGFFCGDNGQFWRIGNGVYENIYTGLAGTLSSVAAMSENEAFFCGTHTYYFNGTAITTLLTTNTAYSMDMFDDGLGWVIDNYGETDGFVSLEFPWVILHPESYVEHLYDIDSPNGKDVWAVGAYGLIRHSPNGDDFYINSIPYDWGNNTVWNTQAPGLANASLVKVFFTSPVNGYAVGDNGTILKYSLLEGAPEGADILSFHISEQVMPSVIDGENLTVYAEVNPDADLTSLVPELFLSAGATCDPPSGVSQNFSGPVDYVVMSADGTSTKNWTISVVLFTGIDASEVPENNTGIVVFPNPTSGVFSLQSSVASQNIITVDVVDLFGKPVLKWKAKQETQKTEHDLSSLSAGIYFIMINLENQMIVKKIIKL